MENEDSETPRTQNDIELTWKSHENDYHSNSEWVRCLQSQPHLFILEQAIDKNQADPNYLLSRMMAINLIKSMKYLGSSR